MGKAMEDIIVDTDLTVRNSNKNIIQFQYGDDGFDAVSVERNKIRFLTMTEDEILLKYRCFPSSSRMTLPTQKRWNLQIFNYKWRKQVKDVFVLRASMYEVLEHSEFDDNCLCPVPFSRLLRRAEKCTGLSDVTPFEISQKLDNLRQKLPLVPSFKLECLLLDYCSTATVWKEHKLSASGVDWYFNEIEHILITKCITPNESVGSISAQNCAEPLTQMTLNRFHLSGQFSHLVSGVARIKEIVNVVKAPQMTSMTIFPIPEYEDRLELLGITITQVMAYEIISSWKNSFDSNDDLLRDILFKSMWIKWNDTEPDDIERLVFIMDKTKAIQKQCSPIDLANALRRSDFRKKVKTFNAHFSYSSIYSDRWWVCFSCSRTDKFWLDISSLLYRKNRSQPKTEMILMYIYHKLIDNSLVKGCEGIMDFFIDSKKLSHVDRDGNISQIDQRVIVTEGSNLPQVLGYSAVNKQQTTSNFIIEIFNVFGIDAACEAIENELISVMSINKAHVGSRHLKLLAEAMCFRGVLDPMTYQGICHQNTSVMKKAAFEKTMESFTLGAVQGHLDNVTTATESIAWNGKLRCGTGGVTVFDVESESDVPLEHKIKTYAKRFVQFTPPPISEINKILEPIPTQRIRSRKRKVPLVVNTHKLKKQKTACAAAMLNVCFHSRGSTFVPYSPKTCTSIVFCKNEFEPTSPE